MPGRRDRRGGGSGRGPGLPQPWLSGWFDPELEDLFRDQPELRETARLLRMSRPETAPDPHYRTQLRNHLMAEAERSLRRRGLFGWLRPSPAHFAWGGAGLGVVLIGATVLTLMVGRVQDHQSPITAFSPVAAQHAVSPAQVITVAFNQPMDRAAVESGLHIEPATQVRTSWNGNNLVITPVHHLAGNTPYTVTIDQPALRATSGATAQAPLQISFGTAATPPPGSVEPTPPALTPTVLGTAVSGSQLLFAPNGSVVVTSGTGAAASTPESPVASPPASPSPAQSPSPSAAPVSPFASPSPSLIELPLAGTPLTLAASSTAASFGPDGRLVAAVSDGHGGSNLVVSSASGTKPTTIADIPSTVTLLTWSTSDTIVFATGSSVSKISHTGAAQTLITLPAGSGPVVALAPGGAYAYVAPASGTGGELVSTADGKNRLLAGSARDVAFSGDGKSVAWVDRSAPLARLLTEPVDRDAATSVSPLDPSAGLSTLSLNSDGTVIAYVTTPASGSAHLVVAQLPSGAPIATAPEAATAVISPDGNRLAFISPASGGSEVEVALLPGSQSSPSSATVPAAANDTLQAFVDAQVAGDDSALTTVSGPGVDAVGATPKGLSRANIVSATVQPDGTVAARVELLIDPTATHSTALLADETLTLARASDSSSYVVTAIEARPLHDLAAGPHVVHVGVTSAHGRTVLQVSFDSDLALSTVPGALTVQAGGLSIPLVFTYDDNTRTSTATLPAGFTGVLNVAADTSLRDINGAALATTFQTQVAV